MKELGIEVKHAHSPQAKGRVERANKTLQDRLIKEMRLEKIDEANLFLQTKYLEKHNSKFALKPELEQNLHRSIEGFNLDSIFCYKEKRIMQNDFVVSYKTRLLSLHKDQRTAIYPKDKIIIHELLDHKLSICSKKI